MHLHLVGQLLFLFLFLPPRNLQLRKRGLTKPFPREVTSAKTRRHSKRQTAARPQRPRRDRGLRLAPRVVLFRLDSLTAARTQRPRRNIRQGVRIVPPVVLFRLDGLDYLSRRLGLLPWPVAQTMEYSSSSSRLSRPTSVALIHRCAVARLQLQHLALNQRKARLVVP